MQTTNPRRAGQGIVPAEGETAIFRAGEHVRISDRRPVGHYRMPTYLRGKHGQIEGVIEPALIDNEAEGYGHNVGSRRHYYRVAIAMTDIWPDYKGEKGDVLFIETFETWLEKI